MTLPIDRFLLLITDGEGRLCVGQGGSQSVAVLPGLTIDLGENPISGQLMLAITHGERVYQTGLGLPRAVDDDIRRWMRCTLEAREGKQPNPFDE